MSRKTVMPMLGFKFCMLLAIAVTGAIVLMVMLTVLEPTADGEFIEDMICQAGLNGHRRRLTIEESLCDNSIVDARAFLKLRSEGRYKDDIVKTMSSFHVFAPEIALGATPSWWKPSCQAERMAYYIDSESASPVILAYIDDGDGEIRIFLVIIPV